MAEGLLQHQMVERGVPGRVSSAGLVYEGEPAEPLAIEAMAGHGLDIAPHRSRRLAAGLLADVDLVLGMERRHVREVVVLEPSTMPKAFTLKELVRRGEAEGPRRPERSVDDWLAAVAEDRTPNEHLGMSPADDVADPLGGTLGHFRRTALELDDLTSRLADLLWPGPVPAPVAPETHSHVHGGP